jgi:hypothetical protein
VTRTERTFGNVSGTSTIERAGSTTAAITNVRRTLSRRRCPNFKSRTVSFVENCTSPSSITDSASEEVSKHISHNDCEPSTSKPYHSRGRGRLSRSVLCSRMYTQWVQRDSSRVESGDSDGW